MMYIAPAISFNSFRFDRVIVFNFFQLGAPAFSVIRHRAGKRKRELRESEWKRKNAVSTVMSEKSYSFAIKIYHTPQEDQKRKNSLKQTELKLCRMIFPFSSQNYRSLKCRKFFIECTSSFRSKMFLHHIWNKNFFHYQISPPRLKFVGWFFFFTKIITRVYLKCNDNFWSSARIFSTSSVYNWFKHSGWKFNKTRWLIKSEIRRRERKKKRVERKGQSVA